TRIDVDCVALESSLTDEAGVAKPVPFQRRQAAGESGVAIGIALREEPDFGGLETGDCHKRIDHRGRLFSVAGPVVDHIPVGRRLAQIPAPVKHPTSGTRVSLTMGIAATAVGVPTLPTTTT